jgi:hypothetical protein
MSYRANTDALNGRQAFAKRGVEAGSEQFLQCARDPVVLGRDGR